MRSTLFRAVTGAIAATACLSGALVVMPGGAAVAEPSVTETGITHTVRLTPDTARTWTVPEGIVGDISVEIAGAVGAPSDNSGGSGARFRFAFDPDPGTVLQARFGSEPDGRYASLAGGGGGGVGNRGWSFPGGGGGDATLLTRVAPSSSCASATSDLVAVAGGGGGATGKLIESSWSASRTPGESSTRWDQLAGPALSGACQSGVAGGNGLKGERKFHHDAAGGGGGGGGLVAGAGGRADEMESAWWSPKILVAATGGRAGTSYLSTAVCGNGCATPAIDGNRGAGYVVLRFVESLSSSISLNTDDGRVLRERLSGSVSSSLAGQVPAGIVSAWLNGRRIADARVTTRGEFSLDILGLLPAPHVDGLQVRFVPDGTGTRPASRTISLDAAPAKPALIVRPTTRSDGTRELEILFAPNAPSSVYSGAVTVQLSTRRPGDTAWTSRGPVELGHHPSVQSDRACGVVRITGADGPVEISASYGGATWLLPVASDPLTFDATAPATGRSTPSCGTPVTVDISDAGGASAPATPGAAASRDAAVAVEWAESSLEASSDAEHELAVEVSHDGVEAVEGRVDFFIDGAPAASSTAPVDGLWRVSLSRPPSGSHSVLAVYSDASDGTVDASHGSGMSDAATLVVPPVTADLQLAIVNETPELLPDDPIDLVAEISAPEARNLAAEVAFFADDELIGVSPLDGGRATLDDVILVNPSGHLTARLSGGADRFTVRDSEALEYALYESPLAVDLAVGESRIESGAPGDLVVSVTPLGESVNTAPTGELTLWADDTALVVLPDSEALRTARTTSWRIPLAYLPAGVRSVRATVAGDPGFGDGVSRVVPLEVVQRPTRLTVTRQGVDADRRLEIAALFNDTTSEGLATTGAADGTARVFDGQRLVGEVFVVDGRAEIAVPAADALRVEFVPLSRELASSTQTVRTSAGALASTGQGLPVWPGILAATMLAGGMLLVVLRTRKVQGRDGRAGAK